MDAAIDTGTVWRLLSSDLRRYLRRRVPDEHVADDLLQETFLRIHRHLGTIQSSDRLAAWVYRIARNVVHDHYRDAKSIAAPLAEDVADDGDPLAPLRARAGEWLDELIRQLPQPYQDAVRMSEIDGLPQREIAERMALSLSGAKSRVQRGRAMLKEALEACCTFQRDVRGNLVDCEPRPDRTVCRDCGGLDPC